MNSAADSFREAVEKHFAPHKGQFNYENLVRNHTDISRFHTWVDEVNAYRPVRGARVFSSGCGSAGDLQAFLERGAKEAYGVEVTEDMVRLAELRLAGKPFADCAHAKVYDGGKLPYDSDAFDIVFSMHVIEHTKDIELYLRELFRVVADGGIVFLDLPNRYFKMEQHTLVYGIHFLPRKLRDVVIRVVTAPAVAGRLSVDMNYKLRSLLDFHFPSPRQLMRLVRRYKGEFNLKILDAIFIGSRGQKVPWAGQRVTPLLLKTWNIETFRLVIAKSRAGADAS